MRLRHHRDNLTRPVGCFTNLQDLLHMSIWSGSRETVLGRPEASFSQNWEGDWRSHVRSRQIGLLHHQESRRCRRGDFTDSHGNLNCQEHQDILVWSWRHSGAAKEVFFAIHFYSYTDYWSTKRIEGHEFVLKCETF